MGETCSSREQLAIFQKFYFPFNRELHVPKISLIGLPASGKTTAGGYIHQWSKGQGYDLARRPIDAIHRELFPPGGPAEGQEYRYHPGGILEFLQPDILIPQSVCRLIEVCHEDVSAQKGFVMECSISELTGAVRDNVFDVRSLLSGALLIVVSAPLSMRMERNRARSPNERVPDHVMEYNRGEFTLHDYCSVGCCGADVRNVSNTVSVDALKISIYRTLIEFFSPAPTLAR